MNQQIRIASINIYRKDAIGNFCYDLADTFEKAGFSVDLYADGFDENSSVKKYELLFTDANDHDIIFYNHSIYDANIERITQLNAKKIVYFHGITPPEFLRKYQPITADDCEKGIQQLPYLNAFNLLCVNSTSTLNQLKKSITVKNSAHIIPPIVASRLKSNSIEKITKANQSKKKLLSVGRVLPHKKIEDTIKIFSAFTSFFPEIDIELNIVGVFPETDYYHEVMALISALNIGDKINFVGSVDNDALLSHYLSADCYLLMSEHEGFGVPLLEALKADLPILAYRKNSINEVLGDSGCQIDDKSAEKTATLLHHILCDGTYRDDLLSKQRKQLARLLQSCDESVFLKLINTIETMD